MKGVYKLLFNMQNNFCNLQTRRKNNNLMYIHNKYVNVLVEVFENVYVCAG